MSIHPRDILFEVGGHCLAKYGRSTRTVAPVWRGGEEAKEVWTRASTGLYLLRDGTYRSAAVDVPRVEMLDLNADGVFETPSLLVESARTNLVLRSQEFDNAAWTKTRSSISANADTAPDGTATADRLIEDGTAGNNHFTTQGSLTITANATLVASVYFKAGPRTWGYIQVQNGAGTDTIFAWYNLATGVIGTRGQAGNGNSQAGSVQAVGNGWYRCVLVGTIGGGTTTAQLFIALSTGDGLLNYNGDGASYFRVWGAQLENNAGFASSYIATVAATVTRSADAGPYIPYYAPPQAASFYVKFVERGANLAGAGIYVIPLTIGQYSTTTWRHQFYAGVGTPQYGFASGFDPTQVAAVAVAAASVGNTVELMGDVKADGSVRIRQSINAGAEVATSFSAALTMPSVFGTQKVWIGNDQSVGQLTNPLIAAIGVRAPGNVFPSIDEFRALVPSFA